MYVVVKPLNMSITQIKIYMQNRNERDGLRNKKTAVCRFAFVLASSTKLAWKCVYIYNFSFISNFLTEQRY
jgi:hypothetical protein